MKTIGRLIKDVRVASNISQSKLVSMIKEIDSAIHISQATLSDIETEKYMPYPEMQAAIGIALGSLEIIWNYYENKEIRAAADMLLERQGVEVGINVIHAVCEHIDARLDKIKRMASSVPVRGTKEFFMWQIQLREHADWIRLNTDALWLFIGNSESS